MHAYVPTLHSNGPKVSQALVGAALRKHRALPPPQGAGSSAAVWLVVGVSSSGAVMLFGGHSFPRLLQLWVLGHDTCPCPAAVV